MTIDITFCVGKYCNKKETCYRWTALQELKKLKCDKPVSMMEKADDRDCDMFWGIEK